MSLDLGLITFSYTIVDEVGAAGDNVVWSHIQFRRKGPVRGKREKLENPETRPEILFSDRLFTKKKFTRIFLIDFCSDHAGFRPRSNLERIDPLSGKSRESTSPL
jgi:hypothetical protein